MGNNALLYFSTIYDSYIFIIISLQLFVRLKFLGARRRTNDVGIAETGVQLHLQTKSDIKFQI